MAKDNRQLAAKLANHAPANGNGKPLTVADQVRNYLDRMKDQIRVALPKHMTPDRMARIALTTIRTNPKLLECSIESLMAAVMQAAQLGLEPGILGQCYFVPFFNSKMRRQEVQFIPGYKGLMALARRSGEIRSIQAQAVYQRDHFEFEYGLAPKLSHRPHLGEDRGPLIAFYAYAILRDEESQFEVMTKKQVDEIRARSKASQSGPWVTDYVQMGRKTVLRRLCNYLPLSVEVATNVAHAADTEFRDDVPHIDLGESADGEFSEPRTRIEAPEEPDPDFADVPDAYADDGLTRDPGTVVFDVPDSKQYHGKTLREIHAEQPQKLAQMLRSRAYAEKISESLRLAMGTFLADQEEQARPFGQVAESPESDMHLELEE